MTPYMVAQHKKAYFLMTASANYITYPAVFPVDELTVLGESFIAGTKPTDPAKLGHAAWVVTGFIMAKTLGEPAIPAGAEGPGDCGPADHPLMTCPCPITPTDIHEKITAAADAKILPPWLLPLLLQILQTLLGSLIPKPA